MKFNYQIHIQIHHMESKIIHSFTLQFSRPGPHLRILRREAQEMKRMLEEQIAQKERQRQDARLQRRGEEPAPAPAPAGRVQVGAPSATRDGIRDHIHDELNV